MTREILFKAKRKDDGRWVDGYYEKRFDVDCSEQHFIFWSKSYTVWEYAEIDPSTLCQYTGLTDKNGNNIWENDIVKHKDSQCFGTIRWYRGDYVGWCVDDVHDYEQQFTMDMFNECEVIGNIFNNSALLEV